ncbi:hypothetical protein HDU87_001712 [Geranomyces variabilis]|uniref:Uncharacterized protein n=1 Tax=Geranomyces variabilis TaxID=109894 RepID=A0AAD5XN86_9FUNG|nr:hypothetical protein HDU87_001712 [Geranomyces variabilis]
MPFEDTTETIGKAKDSQRLINAASTKQLLREFIEVHLMVRDLLQRLKVGKSRRQTVEKDLAHIFTEAEVQAVDIPGFRLYRYDQRLVPYHLPKRPDTRSTGEQAVLLGNLSGEVF